MRTRQQASVWGWLLGGHHEVHPRSSFLLMKNCLDLPSAWLYGHDADSQSGLTTLASILAQLPYSGVFRPVVAVKHSNRNRCASPGYIEAVVDVYGIIISRRGKRFCVGDKDNAIAQKPFMCRNKWQNEQMILRFS